MEDSTDNIRDWEYAKEGITLWLNNDPEQADEHFKAKERSTIVYSGYVFTTVMNAVISYETDKIETAQAMLRILENRCSPDDGWIQSFKTRIFGPAEDSKPLLDALEEKIILADSLICSAILTFLTQDFGGLMKGSWLLRKAWKIYQQTYGQIYDIYKSVVKNADVSNTEISANDFEPVTPCQTDENRDPIENGMHYNKVMTRSHTSFSVTNSNARTFFPSAKKSGSPFSKNNHSMFLGENSPFATAKNKIFNSPKNVSKNLEDGTSFTEADSSDSENIRPSRSSLHLNLTSVMSNGKVFNRQVPFSCPEPAPSPITRVNHGISYKDLNPEIIKRLMGAVSFGYGIFQLSVSLLPPSLLRLISYFGFEGNKNIGVNCLMYSKSSGDMRSPLAALVLLWYYTIGAQLFHIDEYNMEEEIQISKKILKESQQQYATSAIFLFFRGRLKRLQADMNTAIDFYDAAYRMSAQRELKLLCLHEVGWCRLVQLDFGNAMLHFHELKLASNFSKSFYTYLTAISQGAFGRYENLPKLKIELVDMLNRTNRKETQIDKFVKRRLEKFPSNEDQPNMFRPHYWKFFIYEMLFLWNTIQSCGREVIYAIISDCSQEDCMRNEPSVGLANLVLGSCKTHINNYSEAMQAFRQCIQQREGINEDLHLSAFAYYELAMLLLKEKTDNGKHEARNMLQNAQQLYRNYDFENRLSARIHSALKNIL